MKTEYKKTNLCTDMCDVHGRDKMTLSIQTVQTFLS